MAYQRLDLIRSTLQQTRDGFATALGDDQFIQSIHGAADLMVTALKTGENKIMLCGNGGSAADSQHIAAELISKMNRDRNPLPAIALTTDTSILTAIGNDYGYDQLFARQVKGIGKAGDVLIAISTSGRSPNIIKALQEARNQGIRTIGLTGYLHNDMLSLSDVAIQVPDARVPYIQQVHIAVGHILCDIIEHELFGSADP